MLTVEKVLQLVNVDFLSDLPGELLSEIAVLSEEVDFLEGETIIRKGELSEDMYIVIRGNVSVGNGDNESKLLVEKSFFGELSVLSPEPSTIKATAKTDCTLLKIDHFSLYELIYDHAGLVKNIITYLCSRQRSAQDQK